MSPAHAVFTLVSLTCGLCARPALAQDEEQVQSEASLGSDEPDGLHVSGFIQAQFTYNQLSEDEVSVEGKPLNQNRFVLRRARVQLRRDSRWAYALLELDTNTVGGPYIGVSGAELGVQLASPKPGEAPLLTVMAGLFDIPFGHELPQTISGMYFMERSVGSRALFPGDSDLGVQVSGSYGPLRAAVAVQNGVPIQNQAGAHTDIFTGKKMIAGRVGFENQRQESLRIKGGISFLTGHGFHEGAPATKSSLLWSDANQDGLVSLNELIAAPGQARAPSASFPQWAVNGDLALGLRSPLGWTQLLGELTMASNLDRGLFVADPISTGYDLRELSWVASVEQDLGHHVSLGFRADYYNPNLDYTEARRGLFIPTDLSILTLSPAVAVRVEGLGRLVAQYDYVVDEWGRNTSGEPIDLPNDQLSVRAQMEF